MWAGKDQEDLLVLCGLGAAKKHWRGAGQVAGDVGLVKIWEKLLRKRIGRN